MTNIAQESSIASTHPDISADWDYEKNSMNPTDLSATSQVKVHWKCPQGHTQLLSVKNRIKNKFACNYCAGRNLWIGFNDLATKHPELAAEYSDENPESASEIREKSNKARIWICPQEGHKWVSKVIQRVTKGTPCVYCSGRETLAGFNDLATKNPELVLCWDYEKNDDSPADHSPKSTKRVHWKCPEGHEEYVSPANRSTNKGLNNCAHCNGRKCWPGDNDLVTLFPDLMKEWDHDLNDANPGETLPGSNSKAHWVCINNSSHRWEAAINARTRYRKPTGCPYCAGQKVHVGVTDLATTHPDIAASWHPTLNAPLTPADVTSTSGKHVHWQCVVCDYTWSGQVYSRINGGRNGKSIQCARCTNRVIEHGINDLSTVNPALFAQIHPTLNESIDLKVLAPQSKTRIVWSCLTDTSHKPWTATVDKRGKEGGNECPTCFSNISKGEVALRDFILSIVDNPDAAITSDRKLLSGKEIDILIPDLSIGIEYNGIYWHSSALRGDSYHVDKSAKAADKGISLIHIWEDSWSLHRKDTEALLRLRIAPDTLQRIPSDKTFSAPITGASIPELHMNKAIPFPEMTSVHFGLYDISGNLLQVMAAAIASESDPGDTLSIRYNSGDIYVEDGSTVLLDAMIDYASLHDISHVCIDVDNDLSDHSYLEERAISSSAVAPVPQNIFGSVRIGIARKTSPDILHIHDSGSRRYRLM